MSVMRNLILGAAADTVGHFLVQESRKDRPPDVIIKIQVMTLEGKSLGVVMTGITGPQIKHLEGNIKAEIDGVPKPSGMEDKDEREAER